jgi:cellulose synthase/poly-beta-1,6-N-acetylglucosamine synthase-like glycosyltransferase
MIVFDLAVIALGLYVSAYVGYQLALFVTNWVIPDPPETTPRRARRFLVLVPAHNEELHLPRLLRSMDVQEYARDAWRVAVVADNCSDRTAAVARGLGADVFERSDPSNRGKGHAIHWVLNQIDLAGTDAVVILDADSFVNPTFLKHLNTQMERGDLVVQSSNAVANPGQSWFTRLMDISETISNEITSPARSKLGLSGCLLGNGMCFDAQIIRKHGWNAFSIGEDWEYYARLVDDGTYIGYSREARQYHQESVSLKQASSQRIRWTSGRLQVLKQYGPRLFGKSLRTGRFKYIDACLQLAFPNASLAMNITIVGLVISALGAMAGRSALAPVWFATLATVQFAFFAVGVLYTKDRLANARALLLAPAFLVWKLGIDLLSLSGRGTKQWQPTERRA